MFPWSELIESKEDYEFVETLFNQYADIMYKSALYVLRVRILAEEAVQHAFLRIVQYLDRVKQIPPEDLKSYLAAISRNAACDLYRAEKKEASISSSAHLSPETKDPLKVLIEQYDEKELINQMKMLDEKYASVLILKYVYGMENWEIAFRLHISNAALHKRVTRAKRMLKNLLQGGAHHD